MTALKSLSGRLLLIIALILLELLLLLLILQEVFPIGVSVFLCIVLMCILGTHIYKTYLFLEQGKKRPRIIFFVANIICILAIPGIFYYAITTAPSAIVYWWKDLFLGAMMVGFICPLVKKLRNMN